jgi:gp6-like head-tail connector protein
MRSILQILEETTDSAGPDLISLDDLKTALGITGTDEDAALAAAITMQSQIIAEYCDRRLGRATALETFMLDHRESIWPLIAGPYGLRPALTLSLYPVTDIAEISLGSATADGSTYAFDANAGLVWLVDAVGLPLWQPYLTTMPAMISVVYSGGYDLPEEAPARLQRAVIECVASVLLTTGSGSGVRDPTIAEVQHGDTRVRYVTPSFASGAVTAGQHLSPSVSDLIKPYRRLYIA